MTYFGELRSNARGLVAASIGVGAGVYLLSYVSAVFSPHLVRAFGWSREQFALLGISSIAVLFVTPVVGFAVDRFGPRKVAVIGVVGLPAVFVAASQLTGNFYMYMALMTVLLLCGMAASPVVYTRVVAERITRARGLALTIIMSTPAVFGGLGSPLLQSFVQAYGWRTGYLAVAAFLAVGGGLALWLLPPSQPRDPLAVRSPRAPVAYGQIFRNRAFWMILIGLVLTTLPTTVHTSQATLMLLDNHLSSTAAVGMLSVFAAGTLIGRIVCGVALDRFPAHLVVAISMGLPAIGLGILWSSWDAPVAIAVSMFLVGLSYGAEGDVVAFMVARWFKVEVYSSVLGFMFAGVGAATAIGAILLAATLRQTHSYALFLGISSATVTIGSLLFLMLGRPVWEVELEPVELEAQSPIPQAL